MPNEITGKRTLTSKTYARDDGKTTVVASVGPIHYQENGQWEDIDTTIVHGEVHKAPYDLTIDFVNHSFLVKSKLDGSELSIKLRGSFNSVTPEVVGNKVIWHNLLTDTDVVIDAQNTSVRFKRILKSSNAKPNAEFDFTEKGKSHLVYRAFDGNDKPIPVSVKKTATKLTENIDLTNKKFPIEIDPTFQISASTDDCYRVTNSNDLFGTGFVGFMVGYDTVTEQDYGSAARFLGLNIPSGSTIDGCVLIVTARVNRANNDVNTRIRCEKTGTPATFSTSGNFDGRTWTTAEVNWDTIAAWTDGVEYTSPEIKTCVQEIIDVPSSITDLSVLWDDFEERSTQVDTTTRVGQSYNGASGEAPQLTITFTPPPIVVTPGTLALSLSTFAPTIIQGSITQTPTTLALSLSTFAPLVTIGHIVTPITLALSLTTYAPEVSLMSWWNIALAAKTNISVKLFDRDLSSPTIIEDLTTQVENMRFSTKLSGGYNACSFTMQKTIMDSWKWMTDRVFYRLIIEDGQKTLFEGRIEDRSIEGGSLSVTAYGYYANLTDIPYNTAYNDVASVIVKAILTAVCTQINADQSNIDATDITITSAADSSYLDIYPQQLVEKLLAFSDSGNTGKWYFAIWEDRIPYMYERSVSSVDWLVNLRDLSRFRLTHRGADLWNAAYAVYANGGLARTGDADDTDSQSKYGYTSNPFERKFVIPSLGVVAQASAEAARDAWVTEHAEIFPKLEEIVLSGTVYNSNGVPFPSSWVRAGEVIRVRDLVPASATLDSVTRDALRTFYIVETQYNADNNTNRLVVDTENASLEAILAREL